MIQRVNQDVFNSDFKTLVNVTVGECTPIASTYLIRGIDFVVVVLSCDLIHLNEELQRIPEHGLFNVHTFSVFNAEKREADAGRTEDAIHANRIYNSRVEYYKSIEYQKVQGLT